MPTAVTTTLRSAWLSAREFSATAAPFGLVALLLLALAYRVLDPNPPDTVVLATGVDQGAYAEFGKRYAAILKSYGVRVELRPTQGAAENLALLRDPAAGVDLAFVQGGADDDVVPQHVGAGDDAAATAAAVATPDGETVAGGDASSRAAAKMRLVSLGSLFYEPVWLFYRHDAARRRLKADALTSLSQLRGWRVNIGAPGSGVPNLMAKLIDANGLQPEQIQLLRESQTPAVMALLDGHSDAVVFASAPESLMVQMLLQTPGIRLFDFAQAEAYSRRFPFMSPVTLPRGVVDLARDLPPNDVRLVAPTATLVARAGTHPALIQLFVQAAQQVHGGAGWFQHKGEFPTVKNTERPLAKEAQRFYKDGPPLLQRYLPFWLANLIDRMWPVLLSIAAILIPLSRMVPPLYEFRVRRRIFCWYGQLQALENAHGRRPAAELATELDAIETRVADVSVPLSYADELYALRGHIGMVRRRLLDPHPGALPLAAATVS